jgi:hypothetical protein
MADDTERHPAVELLLARMESHPEEFVGEDLPVHGSRAYVLRELVDKMLDTIEGPQMLPVKEKMDQLHLDMYHKELMEELLSGDDKRAQEAAMQEAARQQSQLAKQQQYLAQLQQAAVQSYPAQLQQSLAQTMQLGLAGSSPNMLGGGGGGGGGIPIATSPYSNTITGTKANSIMIDDQVLDGPMIKRMKRMLSGRSK